MFAEERQREIMKALNIQGTVRVSKLSKLLHVTDETIRRDLEKLEAENKLKRTHGGAILFTENSDDDIPFIEREILNKKQKLSIAKTAAALIEEGDIIFLDAGSTSLYLAKVLHDFPITIITNSLLIAYELSSKKKINVILTGGNLTHSSLSLVGLATVRSIQNYHIKKMFFSCKGFDKEWGISDSNEQQAAVKRAVIDMSDKKILLMDYSKVEKRSFVYIDSAQALDFIIVDSKSPKKYFDAEQLSGVEVIFSEN